MNARLDPRMVAAKVARGCGVLLESVATAIPVSQGPATAPDIVLIPYSPRSVIDFARVSLAPIPDWTYQTSPRRHCGPFDVSSAYRGPLASPEYRASR